MQAVAGCQHNAADNFASDMLGYLHNTAFAVVIHYKGVLDMRKVTIFKCHVNHRSHDLYDLSFIHGCLLNLSFLFLCFRSADDLGNLLSNSGLTHTVIFNGQLI